jgi:tRNA-2-methylthio-N6-dimethylallyladenosine synthase
VPYTRGLEIDRSGEEILAEVKKLIKDGFKEIWLLGQTASSWKDPKNPQYQFVDLLSDICKIPGRFWLRFTSPYLLDFDDELIAFLAKNEKVSRHWNLPLQSGSNKILAKMNRKYTVEKYWEILGKIKNKIPDFSFSTDIIVGFCGETKNDFQQTYDFFAKIKPTMAFIARYSPRPGTVSQKLFKDNVSPQIKKVRYQKLTKLLRQVARENLEKEVGRQLEVLVDSWLPLKKECLGKTRNYKTVRFKSQKSLVGQFVSVKIIGRREFELAGQLI